MPDAANLTSLLPVFICYRQSDGMVAANQIYEILHGQLLPDSGDESPATTIDVYFDQRAAAVSDWTAIHEPFLKRSRALIVICSPGAKIREAGDDWVHREIDWWLQNRDLPPILVDPLGQGSRYVPDQLLAKWPNAQRIEITPTEWAQFDETRREAERSVVRDRLISGIRSNARNFYREELEREKARASQLSGSLENQKRLSRQLRAALFATSLLALGAVISAIFDVYQRGIATRNLEASLAITERVTSSLLIQSLHAGGHPGEQVVQMLRSINENLASIDPKFRAPTIQVLRFKILQGIRYQNSYLNTDDNEGLLECRKIVSLLLSEARDQLANIEALDCLGRVMGIMHGAHWQPFHGKYDAFCELNYEKLLDDIVEAARSALRQNASQGTAKELVEKIRQALSDESQFSLVEACSNVSSAVSKKKAKLLASFLND